MDQKEFIKALPEMKYSSYETLKDPKRQIILILLFDTSHKKKNDSHLGSSTQDLKSHSRQDTYFRNFLKEMELFRVKQRQKNLRIQKQTSPTVTPPKHLEFLPVTMHKIKDEVSTAA